MNSTRPDRSAAILQTDNQTVFLMTTMQTLTKKGVRRRMENPPNVPERASVRDQVGSGPEAEATPELNNALQPVLAMSERPGSVYAVFAAAPSTRLT